MAFNIGLAEEKLAEGQYGAAIDICESLDIPGLSPDVQVLVWNLIGRAHLFMNQYQEAADAFEEIVNMEGIVEVSQSIFPDGSIESIVFGKKN